MDHLAKIPSLRDLYMMGNPSQANWGANFNNYVIARLPQIRSIDGTEITRSMQILARQQLGKLQASLCCNNAYLIMYYQTLFYARV